MIKFSLKNISFTVDLSFFAVIAVLCLIENGSSILAAMSVCFIHETGHIIAMLLLDERIKAVKFYGTGIRIVPYKNPLKPLCKDLTILFAGSAFNFLAAVSVMIFAENMQLFAVMNIIIGIFNLLPYSCSDGGEIMVCIMEYYGNDFIRQNTYKILKIMSIITSAVIFLFSVRYGVFNFTLAATLVYLMIC